MYTHHGVAQVDIQPLVDAVLAVPASEWVFRNDPESYETLVLRENHLFFPKALVAHVAESAGEAVFGEGSYNRAVLSKVPPGTGILAHTDDLGEDGRRSTHCHIPLLSGRGCVMGGGVDGEFHMEVGHLYGMDASVRHWVRNESDVDRIHLLFAYFQRGH